jgi:DNA-binding NtrC family response regulator
MAFVHQNRTDDSEKNAMIFEPNSLLEVFNPEPTELSGRPKGVLIIDDEYGIRSILALLLQGDGFRVFLASNGTEAAEVWDQERDAIDLVLCDISLPECSGPDVIQSFRQYRPDLKVIFMSGMFSHESRDPLARMGNCRFLEKPFQPRSLTAAIRSALDEPVGAIGK